MHNFIEIFKKSEFFRYFTKKEYKKDDVIFNEGDDSDSLYIVEKGEIIVEKSINKEKTQFKDLSIISHGSLLGEIALFESSKRTARARALNDVVLYEIKKEDFFNIKKQKPEIALDIFTYIIQTLSIRLMHTSKELTLLYDISKELSKEYLEESEFISSIIDEISLYFPNWNIEGYLYNIYNEEFFKIKELAIKINSNVDLNNYDAPQWIDAKTYIMPLKSGKDIYASLLFIHKTNLNKNEINDFTTIFNTIYYIALNGIKKTRENKEKYLLNKLKQKKGEI